MTSRWTAQANRRPTASAISVARGRRCGGAVDIDWRSAGRASAPHPRRPLSRVAIAWPAGARSRGPGRRAVSRQPCWPQAQRAPPGSTMTWPISPARPRAPRWSRPSRTTPADDAGPDREVGEVVDVADDAAPMEAEGGGADVVLDDARATERGPRAARRAAGPCQPRLTARVTAGQRIDPAGDADAERRDVVGAGAGVGERVADDRGDLVGGAFRAPAAVGATWRARTCSSRSTTRTAILLPPTSTPTRSGRSRPSGVGRSSMHRQAELAGEEQRAGAEEREVLADPAVDRSGSRARAGRGCGGWPRRGWPPATARRGRSTVPWTTISRTSRMPMRLATAAPRARPAARVDGQRGLVAGCGRGGEFGECLVRAGRRPRAARRMAGALATVSRQPKRPQWHSAPSGSTTTWPISPAPSPSPPNSSPSRTRPAPMPRPTLIATRLSGRSSPPNRKVARAAARLSLATIVGRP